MDKEFLKNHLATIAVMLAMIPLDELESYVKDNSHHLAMYDALGPMLDPTDYKDAIFGGRRDDAHAQLVIVQKLLDARRAIEKREEFVRKVQGDES